MRKLGFTVAALAFAVAGPVSAKPATVYAKAGASPADLRATLAQCEKGVKGEVNLPSRAPTVLGAVTTANIIGGAVGGAIGAAYWNAQVQKLHIPTCMRAHGFAQLDLTETENAAYAGLPAARQQVWLSTFMQGDISDRVAAALRPRTEALPVAADDPFAVAGARIDPKSLTLATEALSPGEAIVSGQGGYRRAGRMTIDASVGSVPLGFHNLGQVTVVPGSVFHQIYVGHPERSDYFEERTLWCGPGVYAKGTKIVCVASGYLGYRTMFAEGQPWLAYVDPNALLIDSFGGPLPIHLEEADPATFGIFPIELQVAAITAKSVQVRAVARREGQDSTFYSSVLYFDNAGVARLPFWDRTLILTRGDKAVTARFEPRDDGLGWYDLGTAKP